MTKNNDNDKSTVSYEDEFGPYQEGEDEIYATYDTAEEFEVAMRAIIESAPTPTQ